MTEPAITPEWVRKHNLTPEAYDGVKAILGRVTGVSRSMARDHDQTVADIPAKKLDDEAPVAQREAREPEYLKAARAFTLAAIPGTPDPAAALKALLAEPSIASKNRGNRPYDDIARDDSVACPGSDAAILRIKEDSPPATPAAADTQHATRNTQEKHIALTVGCNTAYLHLDPCEGAKIAVAEAARRLACTGAVPLAVVHTLNFGDLHNPEILWQLHESVRGLAEGCQIFDIPVIGDNVEPRHQSPNEPANPSPTVAMAGLIEEAKHITAQWFRDEGDAILLLGELIDASDPLLGLGGSAYLERMHGLKAGIPPRCDLEREKELHLVLRAFIHSGAVKSAHSCSGGGLAVALAEGCLSGQIARETPRPIGAQIDLSAAANLRLDALLFGETQGRVIISTSALDAVKVLERAKLLGIRAERIGTVGGDSLSLKTAAGAFSWPVAELYDLWRNAGVREGALPRR